MRELSLHILDIIQNSIKAASNQVKLIINEDKNNNKLFIKIKDNGKGMDESEIGKVVDPFITSRTTRDVGLGLPLFKAAVKRCDGDFELKSNPGSGTNVKAEFKYDHIDRAPLGDIIRTLSSIITSNPDLDLIYKHIVNQKQFIFKTNTIKKELEDVKINHPKVIKWIENYLEKELQNIGGGE
jgi:hypothetical protein